MMDDIVIVPYFVYFYKENIMSNAKDNQNQNNDSKDDSFFSTAKEASEQARKELDEEQTTDAAATSNTWKYIGIGAAALAVAAGAYAGYRTYASAPEPVVEEVAA